MLCQAAATEVATETVLKVSGGVPLKGAVKAAGAKNAITKLLVASLLSDKRCIFTNVPDIREVDITVELCKEIGMEVVWDRKGQTMEVITREIKTSYIPQRFSGANRIPISQWRAPGIPGLRLPISALSLRTILPFAT